MSSEQLGSKLIREPDQILSEEDQAALKVRKELQSKYFGEAITNLLTRTTPKDVVRYRPGRGRLQFRYVPIAWFIDQLNALFGFNWDFEIIEHGVEDKKHIWVKGKLTVRIIRDSVEVAIVKTQYGGSEIKKAANTGAIIDYADDLKSAASDCLKKCASLIGLAWDVYSGDREALTGAAPLMKQLMLFYEKAGEVGMVKEAADEWFKKQEDINPEGKAPEEVVEADLLGAFPKLREMKKEKSAEA